MLSAVAARKAQQQQQLADRLEIKKSGSKLQVPRAKSDAFAPSSSNPSAPITGSLKSASDPPLKRKRRNEPLKPAERSQQSNALDMTYEPEVDLTGAGPSSESPRMSKIPRRAWSPSQPMGEDIDQGNDSHMDVDMSEDEEDADDLLVMNAVASPVAGNWRTSSLSASVLSSFKPEHGENVFLSLVEGGTIIILEPKDTLCFMGSVSLTVIHGAIEVLGSILSRSSRAHPLYAPRCDALPVLSYSASSITPPTTGLPREVLKRLRKGNSAVLLRSLSTGIEGLGKVCGTFDGVFGDSDNDTNDEIFSVKGFKPVFSPTNNLHPFTFTPDWRDALEEFTPNLVESLSSTPAIHKPMVLMVKGPKRTGKSTFARTILNRLCCRYRQVAFLDCDLGQSEFSPGGMVSLHVISQPVFGPPFTHPRQPYAAHYIGSITPRSAPSQYIASVVALLQTYRLDLQYASTEADFAGISQDQDADEHRSSDIVPLVVNTQGWTKGLGADLMRTIEDAVQPTHVFEFAEEDRPPPSRGSTLFGHSPSGDYQNRISIELPGMTEWAGDSPSMMSTSFAERQPPKVWTLSPAPAGPLANFFTPADMRAINIMSYFHHQNTLGGSSWRTEISLLATPPYKVDVNVAFDAIVLVGPGSEDVVYEEVLRALNCSVVALVEDENSKDILGDHQNDDSSGDRLPYAQETPSTDPTTSQCHGLAFIRGISTSDSYLSSSMVSLHMLTPVPPGILSRCRVLVKGEMEMPIWAFVGSSSDPKRGGEWKGAGKPGENGGGTVFGVTWEKVPYLAFRGARDTALATATGVVGSGVKKARKNVMRRGQF